jgi:hypothetical protein
VWSGPIVAYMTSCSERTAVRRRTLEHLAATDWGAAPVVVVDRAAFPTPKERGRDTAHRLLERALEGPGDVFVYLEDDLEFNTSLRWNLERWPPLVSRARGGHYFGSHYNPDIGPVGADGGPTWAEVPGGDVYGSQAWVLSTATARHVLEHWEEEIGNQDIRIARLAATVTPLFYHRPSLVQHLAVRSAVGSSDPHEAPDYEADWRAEP